MEFSQRRLGRCFARLDPSARETDLPAMMPERERTQGERDGPRPVGATQERGGDRGEPRVARCRTSVSAIRQAGGAVAGANASQLGTANSNEPITIFGEGDQTRSFCYRDDLVDGIIAMMNGPANFVGPVNLGNQGEFTIRQLADLVIELSGSKSALIKKPLPADDPTRRQPDITLARRHLGWEPKVPLREGLAKTIDWFRTIRLTDYRPPTPNYS